MAEQYFFTSALFFLDKKYLWPICEVGFSRETIKKLTRKINGGLNGIDHRITLTEKYSKYELQSHGKDQLYIKKFLPGQKLLTLVCIED